MVRVCRNPPEPGSGALRFFTYGFPRFGNPSESLGTHKGALRIPEDLLWGSVSREIQIGPRNKSRGIQPLHPQVDFIVGDLANLPIQEGQYDLALALNAIDMLDEPAQLPKLTYQLLRANGVAIQSSPYVWHESVAYGLRKLFPPSIKDSALGVEWLYQRAGFMIEEVRSHLPWLFFKNVRQLEIYSVHLFTAKKIS